jgi:hypothetical protein
MDASVACVDKLYVSNEFETATDLRIGQPADTIRHYRHKMMGIEHLTHYERVTISQRKLWI